MSKRQLPVTDLANISTLPVEMQRKRLAAKREFAPPHSLEFTRRNLSMLFGVSDPLFPEHPRPSKSDVLENFLNCLPKGGKRAQRDREANMLRAKAILDFSESSVSRAAKEPHRSFALAKGTFVRTADPFVLEVDGRACIPSTDLRKSGALTQNGLDFLFSMNFHMILDYDPEFSNFELVHLNYWQDKEGKCGITPQFHSGDPKYSYEELKAMIRQTISIWEELLDAKRRKSSDDDDGFWFGKTG